MTRTPEEPSSDRREPDLLPVEETERFESDAVDFRPACSRGVKIDELGASGVKDARRV